jgi:hypothetical protein
VIVPPIYQPEPVAAVVVRCCERPEREIPGTARPLRRAGSELDRLDWLRLRRGLIGAGWHWVPWVGY